MSDLIIWLPLVAVVAVGIWYLIPKTSQPATNPSFVASLDRFTTAVHEASLNFNAPYTNGDDALTAIMEIQAELSEETKQDVETLGLLWREMTSQIAEYQEQPTASTLQSSILTTRLAKQREVINTLVTAIRARYE